jgi:uncharacterized membrane protein YidH (DUF202 family)
MLPQPQQQRSLRDELEFTKWLLHFPALTVMVWLRRDIGYRLLNPIGLIAVTTLLFVISALAQPGDADNQPVFLLLFAVMTLLLGISQRTKRWQELNRGIRQHSYYLGTSCFQQLRWLPMFCRRNRKIERILDPIFCILIGFALFPVSRALAAWLIFSGVCLRVFEYEVHIRERNRSLDIVDNLIVADRQTVIVEQFEASPGTAPQQPTTGIPTGIGDDIRDKIKISLQNRKLNTNKKDKNT